MGRMGVATVSGAEVIARISCGLLLMAAGFIGRRTADLQRSFLSRISPRAKKVAESGSQRFLMSVLMPVVFIAVGCLVLLNLLIALA